MLQEEYARSLGVFETRSGKVGYWLLRVVPAYFLVSSAFSFWVAWRIGDVGGFSPRDYFTAFFAEVDVHREYVFSGIFIAGMQRFNTALLYLGASLVFLPLSLALPAIRRKNKRIIDILRNHGEM